MTRSNLHHFHRAQSDLTYHVTHTRPPSDHALRFVEVAIGFLDGCQVFIQLHRQLVRSPGPFPQSQRQASQGIDPFFIVVIRVIVRNGLGFQDEELDKRGLEELFKGIPLPKLTTVLNVLAALIMFPALTALFGVFCRMSSSACRRSYATLERVSSARSISSISSLIRLTEARSYRRNAKLSEFKDCFV
jgi:hypothetical protein